MNHLGGPNIISEHCPYKREEESESDRRQCDSGSSDCSDVATSDGLLAASRRWEDTGKNSSLEPLKDMLSYIPILDF